MTAPTMKINPVARAIQDRLVTTAVEEIKKGNDVLIVAPTGSGKTYIGNRIAAILTEERNDTVVMLQMRKRIAMQNDAKAEHSGIDPTKTAIVMNGEIGSAAKAAVVYALPQTLAERPGAIGDRTVAIIDEVHRAVVGKDQKKNEDKELNRVLSDLTDRNPKMAMIGMTASPFPSEGHTLHPRMQAATRIMLTYQDAIDAGMITPIRTATPDYPLKGNRWLHKSIEEKIDDRNIDKTRDGLQTLIRQGRPENFMEIVVKVIGENGLRDKPLLGFADRIEEAKALTDAMNAAGMKAGMIHSQMPQREINERIKDYEEGRITKLNSVDMIGEGFDAPNTAGVVNIKSIMTRAEYVQINGRAQRALKGADGIMLDFGASTHIYGSMEEFRKTQHFLTSDKSNFNPWMTLTKEPYVRALATGKDVYFAIAIKNPKNEKEAGYHIVRSFEDRKTQSRKLEHVLPGVLNAREVRDFAKQAIERNETHFMALRTRREFIKHGDTEKSYTRASIIAAGIYKGQKTAIMQMSHGQPIGLEASQKSEKPADKKERVVTPSIRPRNQKDIGLGL